MKRNLFTYLAIAMLPGLLLSCGEKTEAVKRAKTEAIPVKIIPLVSGTSGEMLTASGRFTTNDEVFLSFKIGGVIQKILVQEGDAVKQGQVLAVLNLTEIGAQTQQAALAVEKAQRDLTRAKNLFADSVATLEQVENAETALKLAKQQFNAVQFNKSFSEIRAPRAGYVLRKLANEGMVVEAGTPVLQTNGAHADNWLLRVGISDRQWAMLKVNDRATIETEALPGIPLEGLIQRKSEGVDPATSSFTADIRILSEKPLSIASGMYGKAVISLTGSSSSDQPDYWSIPFDALLDGDGSTGYVFTTYDGRIARKQKVTIAGMDKDKVLISDGLQNVSKLIVSGSAYLKDSSAITITP